MKYKEKLTESLFQQVCPTSISKSERAMPAASAIPGASALAASILTVLILSGAWIITPTIFDQVVKEVVKEKAVKPAVGIAGAWVTNVFMMGFGSLVEYVSPSVGRAIRLASLF